MENKLVHKINLRLTDEDYKYLNSKGSNMSFYLRKLIEIDREEFKERELRKKERKLAKK